MPRPTRYLPHRRATGQRCKKKPSKTEIIMRFLSLADSRPADAAGAHSRASTRIIPTTLISATIVTATSTSRK